MLTPTTSPRQRTIATEDLELVRRIAGHLARRLPAHVERDELVALGNLGLVEARARFDASRGVPFAAFAARRIRGAILDGLRSADPLTRAERSRRRALTLEVECMHVESAAADAEPAQEQNLEAWFEALTQIAAVRDALDVLPAREREIVREHFLDGRRLKQIGEDLGVSESRVSQILAVALRRLREVLSSSTELQPA
jgi:RNA polymerase sigma factor FliA